MHKRSLPIAYSCRQRWDELTPDGNGRHCAECSTTVVDLSSMTERDAKRSIDRARAGGCESLCVRYVVGADGEVEFRSPPPGRGVREWALGLGLGLASLVGGATSARADASVAPCGTSTAAAHSTAQANAQVATTRKPPVPGHTNDHPRETHVPGPPVPPRHALMGKISLHDASLDDIIPAKP